MPRYAVIISDISEKVKKYLARAGVDFKLFDFNPTLNLSDVNFDDRNNGRACWRDCDNFIAGLEWEDYRIKPENPEQAQNGFLSSHRACDRGWTSYKCRAAETEDNPRGVLDHPSWLYCNHCEHYSPNTLEGRKVVLTQIKGQYAKNLAEIQAEADRVDQELKKQVPSNVGS